MLCFPTHRQFSSIAATSTAAESLNHLANNVPDWLNRLKELNSMTSPQLHQKKKELTNSPESKGEPEAHAGATTPPSGDAKGTKPAEEQASPAGPADCDKVRAFFQGLFKFVSTSRTVIRPVKRTAKIAQIMRLAELEHANDGECEGQIPSSEMLMALSRSTYSRTSQTESGTRGPNSPGLNLQPEIYNDLDNILRHAQSMCEHVQSMEEHAARQFLRKCDIDRQLYDIKELAEREMERIEGDSGQLKQPGEDKMRARAYHPPSMRRGLSPSADRGTERGAG